jgi:hypothetical protein
LHYTSTELHKKKTLPTFQEFLIGRENMEDYRIFCQHFVIGVIGSAEFKRSYCNQFFSDFCSISDETMTFLILANNWDAWIEMAEAEAKGEKLRLVACNQKQKFFEGQGRSNLGAKKEGCITMSFLKMWKQTAPKMVKHLMNTLKIA